MSRSSIKNPSHNAAVRIHVLWGDSLLDVIELSPPRPFFIGDAALSQLPVDLTVPEFGAAGETRVPLVTVEDGEPRVRVPFGASAVRRTLDAKSGGTTGPVENDAALDTKSAIDVRLGELVLSVTVGSAKPGLLAHSAAAITRGRSRSSGCRLSRPASSWRRWRSSCRRWASRTTRARTGIAST